MKTPLIFILLLVMSALSASGDSESEEDPPTDSDSTSDESVEEPAPSVVDYELSKKLKKEDSTADVIITMKDSTAPVHKNIRNQKFRNRSMKLKQLRGDLQSLCSRSQSKLYHALKSSGKREYEHYETMWITNQMIVRKANKDDLRKLEEINESNIEHIKEVEIFKLDDQVEGVHDNGDDAMIASEPSSAQWGVEKMRCPKVWAQEITGEGVIVATIDTGVRGTHDALADNYRGEYGWYDPSGKTATPNDQNGHGTHTMGIIAGRSNGIGVAPGVTWMACKGCASSSCSQADLLACGQWCLCPTLPDGTGKDCSKAPHVVSNSWASGTNGTWFNGILDAWTSAGMKHVVASGNTGSACGSACYPGNSDKTIGVGSTDSNDKMSYFSSTGPTFDGRMKPDIAAPGSSVVSSYHTSDTAYATMSGTSMACPHAAGLVALLLSSEPSLSSDDVLTCLTNGAAKTSSTNKTCGGVSDTTFPNHQVGAGRIDAVNAIDELDNL